MQKIPFKVWFGQLIKDLIGKDSYRGVTLTYAWLANQIGHFALGFIPTVTLFILMNKANYSITAIQSALGVTLFWFLFECYNFLVPLLKGRSK
jgi:hypothetical protein